MTTLRGAIRSYGATVRRMEREEQKQAREAAKRFKAQQKFQEIEDVRQAVIDWEYYVNMIQSFHKNCTDSINWDQIKSTPIPKEPILERIHENLAIDKLAYYKPTFFDKLFGLTERRIYLLKEEIEEAIIIDQREYDSVRKDYLEELNNWEELQKISDGIKNKEHAAYSKALEYFNPFSDIGELGTHLDFKFKDNLIDIALKVNNEEVVPNYELKQTSTGKLSKKNMPKGKFNELYQDYICSLVIRVAREVFAYLPIEKARVNAMSSILNTTTGYMEDQSILSVIFIPETIGNLNIELIDPSDSMRNFRHNMKFNKTNGFSVIPIVEF